MSLFINIQEKKNLCQKLIENSYKMNINKKKEDFYKMNIDKKNDKNIGRNKVSFNDDDASKFSSICSNQDNIIKNKDYDPVYFYGII